MEAQKTFTTQSLLILLVGNAMVLVAGYFLSSQALAFFGVGALITLGVWAGVRQVGTKQIAAAASAAKALAPAPEKPAAPPRPKVPEQPTEASAIQMLAILQRKGRLIDFLQEDLQGFGDAQIGAAVRAVHEGCKQALAEHVTLEPILEQAEGSTVTVDAGFNPQEIRLTGNVLGEPPFKGALQHRGWRVSRIELPALMQQQARVVAAAEVEVA